MIDSGKKGRVSARSDRYLLKRRFKNVEDIVTGLIQPKSIYLLYSEPKLGKSLITHKMCLDLTTVGYLFECKDFQIKKHIKTLLIDLENGEQELQKRHKGLVEKATGRFFYVPREDLATIVDESTGEPFRFKLNGKHSKTSKALLVRLIHEKKARFVVIDGLRKVLQEKENDSENIDELFTNLREVVDETGCTIIIIHHKSKGNYGHGSSRGSGDIDAEVDGIFRLEKDYESKDRLTRNIKFIIEDMRKSVPPLDFILQRCIDGNKTTIKYLDTVLKTQTQSKLAREHKNSLRKALKQGQTFANKAEAERFLKSGNVGESTARRYISQMLDDGEIRMGNKGLVIADSPEEALY